jgi:copper chaperone CopZ
MTKTTITVEGMSCDHCKRAVEKAVRALPGMILAEVDLAAKTLKVEYDGGILGPDAIKLAVEEAGFSVAN